MAEPLVDRLALIGVGLIGSSIARAAKRGGLAGRIVGCARRETTRETALRLGVVDEAYADPAEAVRDADLVILAVHLSHYAEVTRALAPALKHGAVVSDVGSVKSSVFRDVAPYLPAHARLAPAHPVAGTERSGPEAGFAELFDGRWCIVTPGPDADPEAVELVKTFWTAIGARIEMMDAQHHDLVLAVTSHLPHLIAYNIVGTAADLEEVTKGEVIKYSAGGFRDFTRIAASDPEFWRDVFLNNREAVLEILGRFTEDLFALQRNIRWGEGEKLFELFARTREIRQNIIAAGQETPAPDFGRRREAKD